MQMERFDGGRYAVVGVPGAGRQLLLIVPTDPRDDYAWLRCPLREGSAFVLVWSESTARWVSKA